MSDFAPTDEQVAALDAFRSANLLGLEAGAGCGKTSTLDLLARSTDRTGRYLAFNSAIVREAMHKFPMNVEASTIHALALRSLDEGFRNRLPSDDTRRGGQGRMKPWDLARLLGIDSSIEVRLPSGKAKKLAPGFLSGLVLQGVREFCKSDAEVPEARHIPRLDVIDPDADDGSRTYANNDALRSELLVPLRRAWLDLSKPDGKLPFEHAHYLKAFERSAPRIDVDFLLVDECQDVSGVMASIVEQSRAATGQQVVAVGDSQQSIYGWNGALNLFNRWDFDATTTLSRSFRFGPEIAEVANLVLAELDSSLRIVGAGPASHVGPIAEPDAVLTRTNAAAVSTLLAFLRTDRRPHLLGGGKEVVSFARAAVKLQSGGKTYHPDLACFDSWDEVQQYVADDPLGSDLALLVKLLDEYGAQIVMDALAGMPAEREADVIISTTHKAKGKEWGGVRLAGDFPDPDRSEDGLSAEELRLAYVAVTRAEHSLDPRLCLPVAGLSAPAEAPGW